MSSLDPSPVEERVIVRFLNAYAADRAAGRTPPVESYLERFPGYADRIRAEFDELQMELASAGSSPDQIGRYRIVRELGRGGQGVVYLAEDEKLQRRVALKTLPLGFGEAGPELPLRTRREVEAIAGLDHPGLCVVYEAGQFEGRAFIAMRYVEGSTLASRIADAPTAVGTESSSRAHAPKRAHALVEQVEKIARAIHAAHEAGVVHRDLKPANVIITPEGEPVVLDFGLARTEDSSLPTLTRTGDLVGTPAYMAPELLRGEATADAVSDVWSLGVILYEALVGRTPFAAPTPAGVLKNVLESEPMTPRRQRGIPRDLRVVIETALSKERARRYRTALDLAEDLRRVRSFEPIHARAVGPAGRIARWSRRHPAGAALFALLALAGVAAAFAAVLFRNLAASEGRARDDAELALDDVERLSDVVVLRRLEVQAERLWPAVPAMIGPLQEWIRDAEPLVARLHGHVESLAALRDQALPYTEAHRRADHAAELAVVASDERKAGDFAGLIDGLDAGEQRDNASAVLAALRESIAERRAGIETAEGFKFASDEAQWQHDVLAKLVEDLRAFSEDDGLLGQVRERLRFAAELERRSITDHADLWAETVRGIEASPNYRGLRLTPQVGLVPLGADRASGLQEFVHLATHAGSLPVRGDDGGLAFTADTGVILVLLPGGPVTLGAQADDPTAAHYDPEATEYEQPVHELELDPFFISKFELTQAQWTRLTGRNEAAYRPGFGDPGLAPITSIHPVDSVSWDECERFLPRVDLALPTEAQWEYAARGGTDTPYATPEREIALAQFVNIADRAAVRSGAGWPSALASEQDDGYHVHAPVDTFPPNGFGLHHAIGNLWEWCAEWFADDYNVPARDGDGLRMVLSARGRTMRGGAYPSTPAEARVSNRYDMTSDVKLGSIGVRPARALSR